MVAATEAKAELIRAYGTQVQALFNGGSIPLVPEVFFFSGIDSGRLACRRGKSDDDTYQPGPGGSAASPARVTLPSLLRSLVADPAHPAGAACPLVRPVRRRGCLHRSRPQCHLRRISPVLGGWRFFLHGPGFFYLEAGWERLLGNPLA